MAGFVSILVYFIFENFIVVDFSSNFCVILLYFGLSYGCMSQVSGCKLMTSQSNSIDCCCELRRQYCNMYTP